MDTHFKKGIKVELCCINGPLLQTQSDSLFFNYHVLIANVHRLMSTFQHLLYIIYADNVGVPPSLGWGCILRRNKQICYIEAQVLSGNVASHWGFQGDYHSAFKCI